MALMKKQFFKYPSALVARSRNALRVPLVPLLALAFVRTARGTNPTYAAALPPARRATVFLERRPALKPKTRQPGSGGVGKGGGSNVTCLGRQQVDILYMTGE